MGFLDRILGRTPAPLQNQPYADQPASVPAARTAAAPAGDPTDEQALARYRYLLRTAPPEQLEKAHAEAFAQLSAEQRAQVLGQLSRDLPEQERPTSDDPQALARAATRAELRQPGSMQRSFGGPSFGGMLGASMLGTIGGLVIGTAIANTLFGDYGSSQEAADAGEAGDASGDTGTDGGDSGSGGEAGDSGGDAGYDTAADPGGYAGGDSGSYDSAGGDFGGDFGGGDFGGGF